MVMKTLEGDLLIVRPDYGHSVNKPDFIQVVVGYRGERANLLSNSALADMFEVAKAQMAPEFSVLGNIERIAGGLSVFFIISETDE